MTKSEESKLPNKKTCREEEHEVMGEQLPIYYSTYVLFHKGFMELDEYFKVSHLEKPGEVEKPPRRRIVPPRLRPAQM